MEESIQLHPPPIKEKVPKKTALAKAMETGVKALPSDKKPAAPRGIGEALPSGASLPAGREHGADGSDSGENSGE